jgi:hypothetical protein
MCLGGQPTTKTPPPAPPPALPEKPPVEESITEPSRASDTKLFGKGGKPVFRRADPTVTGSLPSGGTGLRM